jgi:V/A-type H+-transporting ATPase subunit I
MVVAIQAIRLEYYEFFGKFFMGGGTAYKPIGLGGKPGRK